MTHENPLHTFIAEARDLLRAMEDALLQIEDAPQDAGLINEIFRAAHTIKGSAGLFGLERIVGFTHVLESLLDHVREGALALDSGRVALLLFCGDHIQQLVDHCEDGALSPATLTQGEQLLQRLQAELGTLARGGDAPASAVAAHWRLSLRFEREAYRNGIDPYAQIAYLAKLGQLLHVETVTSGLPGLAADPEECHLGFEVALCSAAGQAEIEAAFEFARDDCHLRLLPPDSMAPAADAAVAAPAVAAAGSAQAPRGTARHGATLRVDVAKMDHHINLVGELIVASAAARVAAARSDAAAMREAAETLAQLVESVRDSALNLRMVPIGATFERFKRLVRDASAELGKDIALTLRGGDTELDKTVVERIADPLTHLVRNAMDHGIETAALRRQRNKPATGQLLLEAYHDAGHIVIEVSDDGGGLDRERILRKAVERGLVAADAELAPQDIDRLIFQPGFSTAEAVSTLSGRGVGMDVVRANIEALRGSVSVDSVPGQGSLVRIRLPLTLAIIDGFQVGVGDSTYVIPLEMVDECIELGPGHQGAADGCLDLRGEVLPFRRLREQFRVAGAAARRESVVVVRYGERKAGLVVDRLMGEFQTVIKPLGRLFGGLPGASGFTILGGGDVALILDIPGLMRQMEARHA